MFFAAIGDIRGNFSAFRAVLNAVDEAGIHTIVQTGGLVAGGSSGAAVAKTVRERGLISVRSEDDRDVTRAERKALTLRRRHGDAGYEALQRAYQSLPGDVIEWLGKMKRTRVETVDNIRIVVCHGAPSTGNWILGADTPNDRLLREREIDAPDIIVSGGGDAFSKHVGGTFFVGTAPLLLAPNQAVYTLIDTESAPWSARQCVVALAGAAHEA